MNSLAALADPTRRQIVEQLARRAMASGEIAQQFDITAPAISQHLKVLRTAGLVRVRAEAQRRIYELDPKGVDELHAWISELKGFWNRRFDALDAELRKPAPKQSSRSTSKQISNLKPGKKKSR